MKRLADAREAVATRQSLVWEIERMSDLACLVHRDFEVALAILERYVERINAVRTHPLEGC